MRFFLPPILFLAFLFILSSGQAAASALIYLSPGSGTFYEGNNFSISLRVNTGPDPVNAVKAHLSFPPDKLQVVSLSTSGSFATLWPETTYNNSTGVIKLTGGLPAPGFAGSGALFATITFKVRGLGSAAVAFTSTAVLRNSDNLNVLGSSNGGNYSLVTAPAPRPNPPSISSSTHPNPNSWSTKADTVSLSWDKENGVTGFSYAFDQIEGTVPPLTPKGLQTSVSYDNLKDGVWYFHLKAQNVSGWGNTANYRVAIDTAPPLEFVPSLDSVAATTASPVTVTFVTSDTTSGVDHYEGKIDKEEFLRIDSPWQPKIRRIGEHVITIKAVDAAGNTTLGQAKILVKPGPVESPIIDPFILLGIQVGKEITFRGKAPEESLVTVYVESGEPVVLTVQADARGRWVTTLIEELSPGLHTVYATARIGDVVSPPSERIVFNVVSEFQVRTFSLLVVFLILTLGALAVLGVRHLRQKGVLKNMVQREDVRRRVQGEIHTLRQELVLEVAKQIESDMKDASKVLRDGVRKAVTERIEQALGSLYKRYDRL